MRPTTNTFLLRGRRIAAADLPSGMAVRTAGTPAADAGFLPSGYLAPVAAFEVGGARRGEVGAAASPHRSPPGEVLLLELVDGSLLVTSAARLHHDLETAHPEALGPDGAILLDRLGGTGVAAERGVGTAAAGGVVRVIALAAGTFPDEIVADALARLENAADLGVTWEGTRVLMAAIERRLERAPGLYRWTGADGVPEDLQPYDADHPGSGTTVGGRTLLFVHGAGSSTLGSFGGLRHAADVDWSTLAARFAGGILGFEHRTLSESPIENAIELATALPVGARLHLVSHSRGGLVADLLCLGDFEALIDAYAALGTPPAPDGGLPGDLDVAHAAQRRQLRDLATVLRERGIVVERYVRVACPGSGTLLAGGNFDVFLSTVLGLIGLLPFAFGHPLYAAFMRVVLEIAKRRTDPRAVPGLEAMLPGSPLTRWLRDAPVRPGIRMATIAGDTEGGSLLSRLGVWLSDVLWFDGQDNDLVVDTRSMLAGIARQAQARVLFDCGAEVSHFRYFDNPKTRAALRDWLLAADPDALPAYGPMPAPAEIDAALALAAAAGTSRTASGGAANRPAPAPASWAGAIGLDRWAASHPAFDAPPLSPGSGVDSSPPRNLAVGVTAMDLRFVRHPLMVGHYERDPIAGPEAEIDRELLEGELAERHALGLETGERGSASAILRWPGGVAEGGAGPRGAVVVGLGSYDGGLGVAALTEAVRTGALRYLMEVVDVLGRSDRELTLDTLLLGYNSSAALSVAGSVEALVRGVCQANAVFRQVTRLGLRIGRLQIVEGYLDTAISAVYALRRLSAPLRAEARRGATRLECDFGLARGEGVRQRLFDDRTAGYWPRLLIADGDARGHPTPWADERAAGPAVAHPGVAGAAATPAPADTPGTVAVAQAPDPASSASPRPHPLAERLRFTFVGPRARAESVALQRQPGLIERLVAEQVDDPRWNPEIGRALFQLMLPDDLKDVARHLDRLVLVVDPFTANLPWEMMLGDETVPGSGGGMPLALRTAVVRQLSTWSYRAKVRQAGERAALVIGNPSVAGFAEGFAGAADGGAPAPLPGAQAEALAVTATLREAGYEVRPLVGEDQTAARVLGALHARPWRFLHVCGHGVIDAQHVDGTSRSGVLLSHGLLLTAAEIAAMETVPELVFLNCCHLGQVDGGRGRHQLAASLAGQLIDLGVRCVVVAGWAVNDESARCFAQTFYEQLLLRRQPFGTAVFEGRLAAWRAHPEDITWGAFQAYGEPGWRVDPRAATSPDAPDAPFVSPEELLEALGRLRIDRRPGSFGSRGASPASFAGMQADAVEALLASRCPAEWRSRPAIQAAIGATWWALGRLDSARSSFLEALGSDDTAAVPLHAIRQLAEVESAMARRRIEGGSPPGARGAWNNAEAADDLLCLALGRLEGLDRLADTGAFSPRPTPRAREARSVLRGAAWKYKASVQAIRLLAMASDASGRAPVRERLVACVGRAIDAFDSVEAERFPRAALERTTLQALVGERDPVWRETSLDFARRCRRTSAFPPMAQGAPSDLEALGADAAAVEIDRLHALAWLVEGMVGGALASTDAVASVALDELGVAASAAARPVPGSGTAETFRETVDMLARLAEALASEPDPGGADGDGVPERPFEASIGRIARRLAEWSARLATDGDGAPPVAVGKPEPGIRPAGPA